MRRRRRAGVELKSQRELQLMRQAGQIVARALAEIQACICPGVTTQQLDQIAESVILQHGGRPAFKGYPGPYPYPAATCISVNEQLVHGLPGSRVLGEGDLVSVDCGVEFQGYYGDAAISVGVGDCPAPVTRLLEVTERALRAGIDEMRPGQRSGDVSAAIQQCVETAGFNVVREYTSHGIGREMHEEPFVPNYGRPGTGLLLRSGLTLALEPMVLAGSAETRVLPDQWTVVAADGQLTAHWEHTVAVTDDEPEILTRLDAG